MHKGIFLVLVCLGSSFIDCAVEQESREVLLALSQQPQQELNARVVEERNDQAVKNKELFERNYYLLGLQLLHDYFEAIRLETIRQQEKAKADQQRLCELTREEQSVRRKIVVSKDASLNKIKQQHQTEWLGVLQRTVEVEVLQGIIKELQRKTREQDNRLMGLQKKEREQADQLKGLENLYDSQLKRLTESNKTLEMRVLRLAVENQNMQRDMNLVCRMRGENEQLKASNKALQEANVALQGATVCGQP